MSIPKVITIIKNLNPKKFKENLHMLPKIAKEKGWRLSYDKLSDSLSFSPPIVPRDSVLFSITDEFAVFVNSKSRVSGVFIESFRGNFLRHNTEFEEILKALNQEVNDNVFVMHDKNKAELYEKALEADFLEVINDKDNLLTGAKFLSTTI